MVTMMDELAKFKADLLKMLAAPIAVPEVVLEGDNMTDLFDDRLHAHRKRPLESEDPVVCQKRPRTNTKVAELEKQFTNEMV